MSIAILEAAEATCATIGRDEEKVYEIVDGVPVEVEPMSAFANLLATELLAIIHQFVRQHRLGLAAMETMFLLRHKPVLQRKPDVAFVSASKRVRPPTHQEAAWDVVPDLAVEVISPTNTADAMDAKVVEYFQAGVRLVWVLFPETRRMYIYESPERMRAIGVNDQLDGGDVLPGFSVRLGDIFAALEDPDGVERTVAALP